MWNPFAKKDNEFKLDEEKIPSLSETKAEEKSVPLMSSEEHPSSFEQTSHSAPPSTAIDLSMKSSNSFDGEGITSSYQDQMGTSQSNTQGGGNELIHHDISKAKMETMEAKLTLIEVKLSSVDQKLELLTQMIYFELSDDTKQKFKINAMMKKIKN